jgi:hypothetical protein
MTQHQQHFITEDLAFGGMPVIGPDVRRQIELILDARLAELRPLVKRFDSLTDRYELAEAEVGLSTGDEQLAARARLDQLTGALRRLQPYIEEFESLVVVELRPQLRERPEHAEQPR